MKPVLAIGDCHGQLDRLEALLLQEGIIGPCGVCAGTGDVGDKQAEVCPGCKGIGVLRLHHDCIVIQLGDLGSFDAHSLTADEMIYKFADQWLDHVLWGNHDWSVLHPNQAFNGYHSPVSGTKRQMQMMMHGGKMLMAYAAHGFLLTHAGLHKAAHQKHYRIADSVEGWAKAFNEDRVHRDLVANIGPSRGGWQVWGGILWRDARESLYDLNGVRQVFGHTRGDKIRRYQGKSGDSFCVDLGTNTNGRLGGIWLPSERFVEVDLYKPGPTPP